MLLTLAAAAAADALEEGRRSVRRLVRRALLRLLHAVTVQQLEDKKITATSAPYVQLLLTS